MAWIQEAYDLIHDPNTICVACISHGKDSLAMLRAIKLLGLPLHRIITSDVWATQDIPANLPPMWEWKKEADKIIKELYGIEVEHNCAMQKEKYPVSNERKAEVDAHAKEDLSQFVQVERERMARGVSVTSQCSPPPCVSEESTLGTLKGFRQRSASGAKSSNMKKLTYEDIFYRAFATGRAIGRIYGFPKIKCEWCRSMLKTGFVNMAITKTLFPKAPRARGVK